MRKEAREATRECKYVPTKMRRQRLRKRPSKVRAQNGGRKDGGREGKKRALPLSVSGS